MEAVLSMNEEERMKVEVHLYTQAVPTSIEDVRNTYQKGSMYCVMQENGVVQKFPLKHIFRATEIPGPKACGGGCGDPGGCGGLGGCGACDSGGEEDD